MNIKNLALAALTFFATFGTISAQIETILDLDPTGNDRRPKENIPLSQFGLGSLTPQYLPSTAGMGGLIATHGDASTFSPINPASLASLRVASLDFGFFAKQNSVNDGKITDKNWTGNLNHIAIGFPTYSVVNEIYDRKPRKVRWAMGLSLLPFSTVGYNVSAVGAVPGDTTKFNRYFIGTGGSYRVLLGNGVSWKNISLGVNLGYHFGRNIYMRQTDFTFEYANEFKTEYSLGGWFWNVGAQYKIELDPVKKVGEKGGKKNIIIGVYGNPVVKLSTTIDEISRRGRLIQSNQGSFLAFDTLGITPSVNGRGQLPSEVTFGAAYENGARFRAGIEYSLANWSEYKNDARPEILKNSNTLAIGSEFIVSKSRLKPNEEKMRVRLGFRMGSDPRSLNGEQVSHQSVSTGISLPVRVTRGQLVSYVNLGLEYGSVGTKTFKEDFFRISLGVTLNDNSWFLKRKFN